MAYDPDIHHRRSIRLADYDYSREGAYFVTVCTEGHLCLLGEIVDGAMRLNELGRIVQTAWDELSRHYPGVEADAFIIMPNHVHAIIVLSVGAGPRACPLSVSPLSACPTDGDVNPEKGQPRGVAPTNPSRLSLSDVVHRFKSLTTNRYAEGVRHHDWSPFPGRLWQRNYYEHIIRNDVALSRILQYIADNPARWAFDSNNPAATNPDPETPWSNDPRPPRS
ncbi:MAG: transposase [Phycisphaerales bacterium]|jgi:REP element-mobilizing transposase RayT